MLARGDAAINLRFPHKGYREKIWDHAAGALIVQEAGAVISDASGVCYKLWHLSVVRREGCSASTGSRYTGAHQHG